LSFHRADLAIDALSLMKMVAQEDASSLFAWASYWRHDT
jgi:hypothetical protein